MAEKTPVDRTTPVGKALVALHHQLNDLEQRSDGWPGADVVDILDRWLEQFDFTAPAPAPAATALPPHLPAHLWVLRRWDRHDDGISLFTDEDAALGELARHVRANWENLAGGDFPDEAPADDLMAVDCYYGADRNSRPDEGYWLYPDTINGTGRARPAPLAFHFPTTDACARANRAAVFHSAAQEGLPCLEVEGIMVFGYLDPRLEAVRVSVHLDSPHEHLVRPDGTVPLRVTVEDTIVLDDSGTEGAPRPPLLDALLSTSDTDQKEAVLAAARSAGILWDCPVCQWDNPAAATCCEGPGPCRTPQPAAGVGDRHEP